MISRRKSRSAPAYSVWSDIKIAPDLNLAAAALSCVEGASSTSSCLGVWCSPPPRSSLRSTEEEADSPRVQVLALLSLALACPLPWTPAVVGKRQRRKVRKGWGDIREARCGNADRYSHGGKQHGHSSKNFKIKLPYDPAVVLLLDI